ncbi:MAG: GAF domain-containing sensor histidine kinase, partial [Candidatus Limnocylindria bacterium]
MPSDASRRFVEVAARRARRRRSDAQALLQSILLDASDLLRASRVAIMLYHADDRTLEILDIGAPAFPGRIVHLGEGVAGRVIRSGRPLVIEDYEHWPGKISGDVEGPPIVSAVAVPLHSGTTPIGALTLHSLDPERRFTMADAHVLELFADLAMLALSHVSLYEEVRGLNRRLERRVRERTRALERSTEEIARKREQLEELLLGIGHAQNDERRRIAQDIHDGVMQTLTGAVYELKALETAAVSDDAQAPRLRNVRDLLHQVETELRDVIQDLQPAELEEGGLVGALE